MSTPKSVKIERSQADVAGEAPSGHFPIDRRGEIVTAEQLQAAFDELDAMSVGVPNSFSPSDEVRHLRDANP